MTDKELQENLSNFWFRIENLYTVVTPHGDRVAFQLRGPQRGFLLNMHTKNVILKSRQHGMTTLGLLYMLDMILFNSGTRCGLVAHTLPIAKELFREKVLDVYAHLPDWLRELRPIVSSDKQTLRVSHGCGCDDSILYVDTSLRSGTYQCIHVSEMGRIDEQGDEKASELVTGTLQSGLYSQIVIESTPRLSRGFFYDTCMRAEQNGVMGLSPMEYRLHFVPWYENDDCVVDAKYSDLGLVGQFEEYFESECSGIDLSIEQKMWYIFKLREFGGDRGKMWREYPSNSAEAFRVANKGCYFVDHISEMHGEGRVCDIELLEGELVNVVFDIGMSDSTALIFFILRGDEIYVIDCYKSSGRGFGHYRDVAFERYGNCLGEFISGHDASVREWTRGGESRQEVIWNEYGIMLNVLIREGLLDQVDRVRRFFPRIYIDRVRCSELLVSLMNYREGDNGKPVHDESSHFSSAFCYMCKALTDERINFKYSENLLERCII